MPITAATGSSPYDAFISYSHAADSQLAPALRNGLQRFATAWRIFRWRNPVRALHIFQDQASLSANPALWPTIEHALGSAEWFILLASPQSAQSRWIEKEVDFWCRNKRPERLLIVQTDGEIAWDHDKNDFDWTKTTALPRRLSTVLTDEPRWIDARWARTGAQATLRDPRFRDLVAELAAPLRGIAKDELIGEDIRQHHRLNFWRNAALGILTMLLIGAVAATAIAVQQRNRAQEALLNVASRESVRLTREGQPEEAWSTLRQAVEVARPQAMMERLPAQVHEAGLLSLIEDRGGPTLSLEFGALSLELLATKPGYGFAESQVGSFSPDGSRVAAGLLHEFGVWRVQNGYREQALSLSHFVERVFYHDTGGVVFAVGYGQEPGGSRDGDRLFLTALDLSSGRWQTHEVRTCRDAFPCIAQEPRQAHRLVDIRHIEHPESLAEAGTPAIMNDHLLVPGPNHMGIAQNRFHVLLPTPCGRDDSEGVMVVFDEATQTAATTQLPGEGLAAASCYEAAVAPRAPLVLVGSRTWGGLALYRIEVDANNGGLSVRRWRTLTPQNSAGTINLGLDADGRTAFYSNNLWGTGGGNGTLLTGAVDVQIGRHLWSRTFGGAVVFSPGGVLHAHSDGNKTSLVNGETGEQIFNIPGTAIAFSPDSRTLLTGLRKSARELADGKKEAVIERASWRLVEVIPIPSMAREARQPRSTRSGCTLAWTKDASLYFRTLADRVTRRWNVNDWRRVEAPEIVRRLAGAEQKLTRTLRFDWAEDIVEVFEEVPQPGSTAGAAEDLADDFRRIARGTPEEIVARYPEARGLIRSGYTMTLTSSASRDGRWTSTVSAYQAGDSYDRRVVWSITQNGGPSAGGVVASGEMVLPLENNDATRRVLNYAKEGEISSFGATDVFFAEQMSAAVVQKDECTLEVLSLPSGRKIGSVVPAFSIAVSVQALSPDLLAVFSSDWYGQTRSIQIIDFPALRQGPWILFGPSSDRDPSMDREETELRGPERAGGSSSSRSASEALQTLFPYCRGGAAPASRMAFTEDGRYLFFRPLPADECEGAPPATTPIFVELPPWGKRLGHLLLP